MHRDTLVSAPSAVALALGLLALPSLASAQATSKETSVKTMWELRAALNAGKKNIYLQPGKYDLGAARLWLGSTGDQLTLRGAGRDKTVLYTTGNADAMVSVRNGNVTLRDLGFDASKAKSKSHTALDINGVDIQIVNSDIIGSNNTGLGGGKLSDVAIIGNRFIDNAEVQNHQIYFISDVNGAVIANNQFYGEDAEMAIKLRTAMNGTGKLRNVALVGNKIHDETGYDNAIGADNPVRKQTLENFIVTNNTVPKGNVAAVLDAKNVLVDSTSKAFRSSSVQSVKSIGSLFKGIDGAQAVLGLSKGSGESAAAVKALDKFLAGGTPSNTEELLIARLLASTTTTTTKLNDGIAVGNGAPTAPIKSTGSLTDTSGRPTGGASVPAPTAVPEPATLLAGLGLALPLLRRRRR